MAFIDDYDFDNLIDEGKRFVIEELGEQLENLPDRDKICTCNDCVVDMAALALNMLPPLYTSSLLGTLYRSDRKSDPVYERKLKNVVKNAIIKVSRSPGHDTAAN